MADAINAGAGTDTLKVYFGAADAAMPAATITGVEKLYLNGGALTTLDASLLSGLTAVEIDGAVQTSASGLLNTITLTGQSVTLSNLKPALADGTAGAPVGAQTFTQKLTSTADTAANVTLNKVSTGSHKSDGTAVVTDTQTLDIAGTRMTTLNLTSSGAANTIILTNSAATAPLATVTIAGDKALTMTAGLANVKTITSTSTAALTIDTSGATANALLAYTGGAGNDKLTVAAGALVSTQTLNGGDGTDTLVIKDTAISSTTTALNAAINKITNFEILGFGAGAAFTADISRVTAVSQFSVESAITTVAAPGAATAGVAGTVAAVFSGETNNQTIIFNAAVTGGAGGASNAGAGTGGNGAAAAQVTPGLDNGSNAVTIALNGVTLTGGAGGTSTGTAANSNGAAALDLTQFETVNLSSNAGTATTNSLVGGAAGTGGNGTVGVAGAGLLVGANATINVTGAAGITFNSIVSNGQTGNGSTNNNNVTLNAGNLTGNLTATVNGGNDAVTGGAGTNTLTFANGGMDTLDLSKSVAKADAITISSAAGATSYNSNLSITGFTNAISTGDRISVSAGGTQTVAGNLTTAATAGTGTTAVSATISSGVVTFSNVGSAATFSNYVDAAFAAINAVTAAPGKEVLFQFGGDSYLAVSGDSNGIFNVGTDFLIKLVGVTGVTALSATASGTTTVWAG